MVKWLKALPGDITKGLIVFGIVSGTISAGLSYVASLIAGSATVPIWALVLAGTLGLSVAFAAGRLLGGPRREEAAFHAFEADLHATYAEHLAQTLDQLQQVIVGGIPGVDIEGFIDRGVLQPARDMLKLYQPLGEDVRLSILLTEGPDFIMRFSAGHTVPGHSNFRMPIADSFSRHAYEQGRSIECGDVDADPRFKPHPQATRPYGSIISVPIRVGDRTVAVFNVVGTCKDAFLSVDSVYIKLLGAILNVALANAVSTRSKPRRPEGAALSSRLSSATQEVRR